MIYFFEQGHTIFVCQLQTPLSDFDKEKLNWLFGGSTFVTENQVQGPFVGPRSSMVTPWSTNAVEITQNMGIRGIIRIEKFSKEVLSYDPMLFQKYQSIGQDVFNIDIQPEPIRYIEDIATYNISEGLALSEEEVAYLYEVSERLQRPLTDSEIFGFSQVNSEHCRHKIFNGSFVIDREEMPTSLFKLIKKTSQSNPNKIVSAYKDNVAFNDGPEVSILSPESPDRPSIYQEKKINSVLSLKAETHNFPTTVEPFNGAATGSGGEIRDRLAGGQGSLPLAGTAVYMTSYSRLNANRPWEDAMPEREWLYQTPMDILIKASNGASDFGNKFGQPLIAGSLLTFEHQEDARLCGFDKVIMLAGGIGYGQKEQSLKQKPEAGDKIVILGGDNYRIGMGGAAVSSADTGAFGNAIELNAIQRSNPEMQKRVANTIRALVEHTQNPIISIHDHGAGGHLNCLSELVEETGGCIYINKLPLGDPTLSFKEIIGNESQERMGLVIKAKDVALLQRIAERERAPMYIVGDVTNDHQFIFMSEISLEKPINLAMSDMFGSSPRTIMEDHTVVRNYQEIDTDDTLIQEYLGHVLRLEAVACKDWLTNKVDRCVGGLVAKQQCCGPLQLPINNCGVMALDYSSRKGLATSIGHAPVPSMIDEEKGARLAITEALTNIVFAPMVDGLKSVSLSANWMWPCRNEGEDARLYKAVSAVSDMAIQLGINIPTGKDSLSMAQKYNDKVVLSPGTVIISAAGEVTDVTKVIEPVANLNGGSIYLLDLSDGHYSLGGSSLGQVLNKIGQNCPDVGDLKYFKLAFEKVQEAINQGLITAGHDISSGGLITTLLELCFASTGLGMNIDLTELNAASDTNILFAEKPGLVLQGGMAFEKMASAAGLQLLKIGEVVAGDYLTIKTKQASYPLEVAACRRDWYETSWLLDQKQTHNQTADQRYAHMDKQALTYIFPQNFEGKPPEILVKQKPKAAIIREKGSNSEREMANAMYRGGFEVWDIHMTDLINGRIDLSEVRFLGAVGGFSNSDVLGSAKGWAGAFKYNEQAQRALSDFFHRQDTLSVGICNGCQLFMELGLIYPESPNHPTMHHNLSGKHESIFTSVEIQPNNSVMLGSMAGSKLGIWVSHGEGRFVLPRAESDYHIVGKYGYDGYPANPNGSDYNVAMLSSHDGRHLVTMPHFERSLYPWNWAYYPRDRRDEVSPWIEGFVNAARWVGSC